ncbi:hypothetical protein, partial [Barnesiella intestinihominis]|uniref:hypothetical protein n=1 Tax=Barnesiella intestinihominis TaxID=487174 RepID=UPI003AEF31BE
PRPTGTPLIFLAGTQGERLRCIPLSPLLRFYTEHPAMLRDTAGEEENTPQSSEGIKRFNVILSILSLCSSQMR